MNNDLKSRPTCGTLSAGRPNRDEENHHAGSGKGSRLLASAGVAGFQRAAQRIAGNTGAGAGGGRAAHYRNTANRHKVRIVVIVRDTSGMYGPLMLDALVKNACARKWVCHTVFEQNIHEIPDCFYDGAVSLIFNKSWARKWVEERATPLVMINSYGTAFDKICSIDPDSSDGSRIVLQHLQQLGHRRIARIHFVDAEEEKYRRGPGGIPAGSRPAQAGRFGGGTSSSSSRRLRWRTASRRFCRRASPPFT